MQILEGSGGGDRSTCLLSEELLNSPVICVTLLSLSSWLSDDPLIGYVLTWEVNRDILGFDWQKSCLNISVPPTPHFSNSLNDGHDGCILGALETGASDLSLSST